jgi:putative colanic acid biosynthesis UDP-glucose lipid carrier transferase
MSATLPSDTSLYIWNDAPARRPALFQWTHGLINRIVALADAALFLGVGIVAPLTLGRPLTGVTLGQSAFVAALNAVVFVFILQAIAAYRTENYGRLALSLTQAGLGLSGAWIVDRAYVMTFAPVLQSSESWEIAGHVPQLIGLVLLRIGARALMGHVAHNGLMRRNTVVIGAGPEAVLAVRRLTQPSQHRWFNVVGVVSDADDLQSGLLAGRPVLGNLSSLMALGQANSVDLVVIAIPLSRQASLPHIVDALQWISADIVLAMDQATAQAMNRPVAVLGGQPVLPLSQKPLKGSQALLKLIEDRAVAALALLILSPFMLLIALAIRLDSPGPVMFRQDRIGLHNRTFRIYKFRTMTVDPSDDGAAGTSSRHNPRITRVGGILRRLSIDELPQLLNVLRGDMSIVGPRPYVRNTRVADRTFEATVQRFAARHRIKPGITGLAQASGFRSDALRDAKNAETSVQLDLDYIANWSLWLDLRIMVRTITTAMAGSHVF